jgi:hypothetical protein
MPPKKKAVKAAKAPAKKAVKAPAKKPVGRPRKPLGTRVSDVDLLANVGSTKPMPRRIGRDALEQQRARIRYAVDYPGRRFTERMTRALQDSFATGALPYGVSLRAPADFKRPYTTTFEPIAGMPVWPAINVPPNADAEDAYRLLDAAVAAASAAPDPAVRPTKRAKRSPGTSGPGYVRDPTDTSEVYVPDRSVQERQEASREHMNKLAVKWQAQRKREIDALRSASFVRGNPIQDVNEELRRQNAAVSFPPPGDERTMAGIRNPPILRSDQERALAGLPPRRRPITTATGPTPAPPPGDVELTADRSAINVRERAQQLRELLSRLPPPGDVELTPDRNVSKRAQKLGELRSQRPQWPPPPSRPPPPPSRVVLSDIDRRRIEELQANIDRARIMLARPGSSSQAEEYSDLRERIRYDEAEIRDIIEYNTLTAPPAQQMVVSVPDPVAVNTELQDLEARASVLRQQLSLKRAGRSLASEKRELESILQRQQDILRETASATPSSTPQLPTVPQSIVVPGTEAPDSQQETIMSQYAIEIGRLNQRILDLQRQLGNDDAQKEQAVRGMRAAEEELEKQIQKLKAEKSALNVKLYVATAPSVEDLRKEAPTATVVSPEELAAIESFVMATIKSKEGLRPGTVDAYMKSGKKIDIEARSKQFQRQLDALNRAKSQIEDPTTTPSELRKTAKLPDVGESARERLLDEADRRDPDAIILREPRPPRVPTITPAQLAMISQEVETDRAPADTVVIPVPSNPPEPSSQDGPSATGSGLQHVTAATFPSSKWTTASSLRWLRSNGLHPIRKSTKINGAYSYALQSPAGYSSFNSVKMSHKNKDFTIVYGTPK